MATEYSIQKMVSDGTLSTIALGIQYLQRNDIYIRIAGEETPQSGAPSGYTWSFLDNTTLKILPVVPNGVEVVVYRRTDVDAMYNIYSQNAQFDEATIDENNQQLLYIAQEYLEQGIPGAGVDIIEFIRDDGSFTYYRIKRTDGSYSDEFYVPSAGSITKVLARESLRRSYAEAGYNLVAGSFEAGGTLVNVNDVLLQERTGKAFTGPAGVVVAGTDPTIGGFVDVSNYSISSERSLESFRISHAMSDKGVWDAADEWAVTTKGRVYVGGRDYVFSEQLSLRGLYRCAGIGRTRLVFTHGGDGVEFYPPATTKGWQYGFDGGLSIVTDGINAGTALKTRKSLYFSQRPKFKLDSLEVSDKAGPDPSLPGFPCVNAWAVGLDVGDVQGCDVGEYYYFGNYNPLISDAGQFNSVALRMDGNETMLFPRFSALWFNAPRRGIEVGNNVFFFVDSVDITRSWEGVISTDPTPFSEVFINRLAINAQKTGVDLANITRLTLGQSFVNSRSDGFEHTDEWVGYKLTNINKSSIGAIQAQPNKLYGGTTAVHLIGGGGVHLESIIAGANIQTGLLADNCAGYKATVVWQSAEPAPAVPYRAINNARSADVTVLLSSSTANEPFSFDGTIDARQQNVHVSGGGSGQRSQTNSGVSLGNNDFCDYRNAKAPFTAGRLVAGLDGTVALQIADLVSGAGQNALIVTRTAGTNTITATELRGAETVLPTIRPNAASVRTNGTAAFPWAGGFTQAAFTVTSDANYKTTPIAIDEALLDVADEVGLFKYQFIDRVEEKGVGGARWHFGGIVQHFIDALGRRGIDWSQFAFLCYDKWDASPAVYDDDGGVVCASVEAGEKYGIRYEEYLVLKSEALARRDRLQQMEIDELKNIVQRLSARVWEIDGK